MNATLVTMFWRQRAASAYRMAFALVVLGFPLLLTAAMPGAGLSLIRDGLGVTMVLAVGMIGQDVSSGVLQLLLARPVRRIEYVVSRWLAVWVGAAALAIAQLALAWWILTLRGAPPDGTDVLLTMAQRAVEVAQIAAVFALLSSLVNGVGDVGLWILANIVGGIMTMAGQAKGWAWVARVGGEVGNVLTPQAGLVGLAHGAGTWSPLAACVSTTAIALALAVVLVNRKELSYASG